MKKKLVSLPTPAPAAIPELAARAHEGTPQYGSYGQPPATPAPPAPDHRTEGGNVYDLSHEQTDL